MAVSLPILQDASLDPDVTGIMVEAYEKACPSLRAIGQPGVVRDFIARRIIEDARKRRTHSEPALRLDLEDASYFRRN
jgi:hypothetical protein